MGTPKLTHERLLQVLYYSVVSGKFYWLVDAARRRKAGELAGTPSGHGYWEIGIDGETHRVHRLAIFWVTGKWPSYSDHVNRNKEHNQWINLRESTSSQNAQNSVKFRTKGLAGAYQDKRNPTKWFSSIKKEGLRIYLGSFDKELDAHNAYRAASLSLFKEFSPYFQAESTPVS